MTTKRQREKRRGPAAVTAVTIGVRDTPTLPRGATDDANNGYRNSRGRGDANEIVGDDGNVLLHAKRGLEADQVAMVTRIQSNPASTCQRRQKPLQAWGGGYTP